MDRIRFALLNDFQRDFPLVSRPFRVLADACATTEGDVLRVLDELQASGAISRIGAVVAPGCIGVSTLGALRVPPERLEAVATVVSARPEVNHNYAREHDYNLWFVATAPDRSALDHLLIRIAAETGHTPIDLPLIREYRIDLGFDLWRDADTHTRPQRVLAGTPDSDELRILRALQDGLERTPTPFRSLATRVGLTEARVLDRIDHLLEIGVIRRFGVVVRHHELGFRANAMAVWNVPDGIVDQCGRRVARSPGVTLAYRRQRHPPAWQYNLFCMVHGKERDHVEARIAQISAAAGLGEYPHQVLFSTRRFKQCGARYAHREAVSAHG